MAIVTDLIDRVKCTVTITLANNQTITIDLNTVSTNYLTSIDINEETATENNNPVGVVSSNTLKMTLNTEDLSLIPNNPDSVYYPYMNNSATVNVKVTSEDGDVNFETFYVSSWKSNISSSNPHRVVIEATDLLSLIGKNTIPDTELVKTQATGAYLRAVIAKLNEKLPQKYRITTDISDNDFSHFPTIQYPSYSQNNMATLFNTISQSTLTNLYLTRQNKLVSDYLLDNNHSQTVATLSDKVNVLSASLDSSSLVNYNSVRVNYYLNTVNDNTLLTSLDAQTLVAGDNAFSIPLSNTYKIAYIKVTTADGGKVETVAFSYSKDTCDLILSSESATTCKIEIYGQTLKENKMGLTVQRQSSSNETLEVTNTLLPEASIQSFATNLLNLVEKRGKELKLEGFFNPELKLGDIVTVDCESSINTQGTYKIVGLNWKIGNTLKCTCKLLLMEEE